MPSIHKIKPSPLFTTAIETALKTQPSSIDVFERAGPSRGFLQPPNPPKPAGDTHIDLYALLAIIGTDDRIHHHTSF